MSSETLEIRREQLNAQLGEDSPDTELAIFDPAGKALPMYGVFDDNVIRQNKDSGNVSQLTRKPRFIISELPYAIDNMINKDLSFPYRNTESKSLWEIKSITEDAEGVQILWLV
jgi:hypothetical protein